MNKVLKLQRNQSKYKNTLWLNLLNHIERQVNRKQAYIEMLNILQAEQRKKTLLYDWFDVNNKIIEVRKRLKACY